MKRLITLLLLSLFILNDGYSQNKDYQIPDIRVDVNILEDGIVSIHEQRTYHFQGSFNWADYHLPKQGFAEIKNIRVSEAGNSFLNQNTEETGTFNVSDDDNNIIIKWFYDAADTSRTFTISYELTDALSKGPEWTEFFWNFIASGRQKPTTNLDINISIPAEIVTDSLYAWTRPSSLQINVNKNPGIFSVSAENLSTNQSLQIRSAFPSRIFDQSVTDITDPDVTLEWIQNDEEAYIAEQDRIREQNAFYSSITLEVTILICVISLAIFMILFHKYGTRYSTGIISGRETILIPDSTPPAVIGRLLGNSSVSGRHLVATLFDLARRGWFSIKEEKKEKEGFFSSASTQFRVTKTEPQPDTTLPLWEKMIVDHINSQIEKKYDLFDELFKEGDFKMSTWFSEWQKEVKKIYDGKKWIDKESYKGVVFNIIAQIILVASTVFMLVIGGTEVALIGLIFSAIMMALSAAIVRRTREGQETYKRWKAYRDGLKNANKQTIRMEMMDRHFIYAVVFGLSESQIEKVVQSAEHSDVTIFPWIVLMAGSNHTPASVVSTVTTLAATSTSTFSGAGGGVGATAGAAGGGASGGAG